MAGQLTPRAIFGVKGDVAGNAFFVEEGTVLCSAGSYLVKWNHASRTQEFAACVEGTAGPAAMCMSANRRHLAVAHTSAAGSTSSVVSVYNARTLSKRRSIAFTTTLPFDRILSIGFSSDDANIILCTGKTEHEGHVSAGSVLVLSVDKGRVVALLTDVPSLRGASFSATSVNKVVVWTPHSLQFYQMEENPAALAADAPAGTNSQLLSPLPVHPSITAGLHSTSGASIAAQAWLPEDYSVVAMSNGQLLLLMKERMVKVIDTPQLAGASIRVVAAYSRGFVVAGADGMLAVFEQTELPPDHNAGAADAGADGEEGAASAFDYVVVRAVRAASVGVDCSDTILHIHVSPTEENVLVMLGGNQMLVFDLAHAAVKDEATIFAPAPWLSHAANSMATVGPTAPHDACSIISMDAAVRKPIVATVGVDSSVRIWNFADRTCEVVRVYPEGPLSVALHPSGFHMLIGFQDKLRLYNLLMEDIKEIKEFPVKACQEVRFSRGGSMLAAASGNVIQLYNAYTGAYIQTLRGHNGKVSHITWSYNDATLLSLAVDGAVYEWDLRDGKRSRELTIKGSRVHDVAASKDGSLVYLAGEAIGVDGLTGFVREVDMNTGVTLNERALPAPASAVALSAATPKMVFTASSAAGMIATVRCQALPLGGTVQANEWAGPSSTVNRMQLSHDDAYLFMVGTDGSLMVFDVRDNMGRLPSSEYAVKVAWSDSVMVTLSDLEDRKTAVRELRDAVAELQSNSEYALRMKDIGFQDSVKRITERFTTEVEAERQQLELLREEKADTEREFVERMSALEMSHRKELQKRESLYQGKLMDEVEKYQALQNEVNAQRALWTSKRAGLVATHEATMAKLTAELERRLENIRDTRAMLTSDVENARRDFAEMRGQMETDLDTEIEGLRRSYQDRLDSEREASLKYKGENGILKKKFNALGKDIEDNKEEIKASLLRHEGLRRTIEALEKDIGVLRSVIHERDITIGEREKRIYDLKKKNQELEKFKFVLDYKIKELKQQIEPREAEIAAMRKQVKEVDAELGAYHTSNAELDRMIGDLRTELDRLQRTAADSRTALTRKDTRIREFNASLFRAVQQAKTPADFKTASVHLAKEFVPADLSATLSAAAAADGTLDVIAEAERQKAHLLKQIAAMRATADEESSRRRKVSGKLVEENSALLAQIRSLREIINAVRAQHASVLVERRRNAASQQQLPSAGTYHVEEARSQRTSPATSPTRPAADATLAVAVSTSPLRPTSARPASAMRK